MVSAYFWCQCFLLKMGSAEWCFPCNWECHLWLHSILLCRTPKVSVLSKNGLHTFMDNVTWLGITVLSPYTVFLARTPEFQVLRREIQSIFFSQPTHYHCSTFLLFIVYSLHNLSCCVQVVKEQIYQACWSFNPMNTFHYFTCNRENCVHCVCINRKLQGDQFDIRKHQSEHFSLSDHQMVI